MSSSEIRNPDFSSLSSTSGSEKKSYQQQNKAICEDLKKRLSKALDNSSQCQKKITDLERRLFDQQESSNQLEIENHQLRSQINSLNEEVSIQKSKVSLLKKDFEKQKNENLNLNAQVNELESVYQKVVQKYKTKSSQLKQLTQIFNDGNFDEIIADLNSQVDELKIQLRNEQESRISCQSENSTLKQQNKIQSDRIERLKNKINILNSNTNDLNQKSMKLSTISQKLAIKNEEYNQLLQNHTISLQKIDDLQKQLSEFQILQQQNQQMKIRIDSLSLENTKLYGQTNISELLQTENEKLKAEQLSFNSQIERLTTENNSLKSRITELEIQNQNLKIVNDKYTSSCQNRFLSKQTTNSTNEEATDDAYINSLRKEIKEMKEKLLEANSTRIERDTLLQDVRILEDKVKKLRLIESENVELKLRIDALLDEINTNQQRENRLNENVQCLMQDRKQLEIVRNKLLKIEDEIDDRSVKEQQLEYQVNFYKSQSREQKLQIDNYEEEIHQLQNELFKYKEFLSSHKAQEKRKDKHKTRIDTQTKLIMKQLDDERKKNIKAKSKIKNLEHTVNRYKVEIDSYDD